MRRILFLSALVSLALPAWLCAAPGAKGGNPMPAQQKSEPQSGHFPDSTTAPSWFAAARRRGLPANGVLLVVSIARQRMYEIKAGALKREYAVSTAAAGANNRANSNGTPLGWHRVADRYGAGARPGQVFVSRRPTSEVLAQDQWRATGGGDYVLSRILHLRGMEQGVNLGGDVDSFDRCIYIHGTNQEQLLGTPASHGCIRLSNRDVMELFFDTANLETYCWILP